MTQDERLERALSLLDDVITPLSQMYDLLDEAWRCADGEDADDLDVAEELVSSAANMLAVAMDRVTAVRDRPYERDWRRAERGDVL